VALTAFTTRARAGAAAAARTARRPRRGTSRGRQTYWRHPAGFTLDRTIINLNNGGCCPSPRVVHEAFKRYLDHLQPGARVHMWQILEPNIETVRRRLAAEFGCSPEEMAITRNASEALQIAQLGIDLKAGDEVVTTNQDYGRMLDTWDQRARRDGITVKKISFPVPPPSMDDLADRLIGAIGPKTKVLHFCHITNLTGQIFPVKKICDAARAKGVKTVVDGAHAFAHFPYKAADLGCDFYGTSLHKWLLAPIGTGFLYVRRENIGVALGRLTRDRRGAPSRTSASSRRSAPHPAREPQRDRRGAQLPPRDRQSSGKSARLRYLRNRWARAPAEDGRVQDPTLPGVRAESWRHSGTSPVLSGRPASATRPCGTMDGSSPPRDARARRLRRAIRVTPNVYTGTRGGRRSCTTFSPRPMDSPVECSSRFPLGAMVRQERVSSCTAPASLGASSAAQAPGRTSRLDAPCVPQAHRLGPRR
jgi:hypothetical protein